MALARALYGEPDLLLLDDPLSAVDASTQAQILAAISAYVHRPGSGAAALVAINQPHHRPAFDRVVDVGGGALTESDTAAAGGAAAAAPCAADAAPAAGEASHVLTAAEAQRTGGFEAGLLLRYFKAIGARWCALYAACLLSTFALLLVADVLLARWVAQAAGEGAAEQRSAVRLLYLYLGASLLHVVLLVGASIAMAVGCVRASRSLHHSIVHRLLHAPLGWYDATPSGRTMSRFTSDIAQVAART